MALRGYLPTLDGWRALAVIAVVLAHDTSHAYGPNGAEWFNFGTFGVDVFFGISGLLICSRLLEEENTRGHISLRGFYVRRAFRILPPLLCYLICVAALAFAGVIPLAAKEWFASLFFGRNYSFLSLVPGHDDWYTHHFWSLSVEEHFYLLLPGLLVFVPRRWRVAALMALAVSVEVWRAHLQQSHLWVYLFEHTDIRLDALLIPAVFAILMTTPTWSRILARAAKLWPVAAVLVAYLIGTDEFPILTRLLESFLIPLVLLGTVLNAQSFFGRLLEFGWLRWIGRLSYSIYLWQQLFFGRYSDGPLGILQSFPMNYIALLACAAASYYWVERPLIRLGHRFAPGSTKKDPASQAMVSQVA